MKRKTGEYLQRAKEGKTSLYTDFLMQNKKASKESEIDNNNISKISGYNDGSAVRDDLDENDENDVGKHS